MLSNINPTSTAAWKKLSDHYQQHSSLQLTELFAVDKQRFEKYHIQSGDVLFDYSKNLFTAETLQILMELAKESKLQEAIEAMFSGDCINKTENRPVLHTALRKQDTLPTILNGTDVMVEVRAELSKMKKFCQKIHTGEHKGFTGKPIKYLVNMGIGGSDLGPVMVTEALKPYWDKGIQPFFVSNVDPAHLSGVLKQINAEETLFLIASKTFTTQETMANAHAARNWLLQQGAQPVDIPLHFVALSTNIAEVKQFGILQENMFQFWDWVGGRYSLWSAIGLSIALTVGYGRFQELLQGAFHTDEHFRHQPFDQNIPVLMALLGIWYRNFHGMSTEAILPYDQHLHRFPAYFQQGNMESNGKSVDRNGQSIDYATGPVIWGEPGTNGQHAFYQLIHQGTDIIPCDFIASAQNHFPLDDLHEKLLSNFFAQTEALMNGTAHTDPFRVFKGNRPTNSFLIKKLTPFTLGQMIAFYEHKIFVQGIIWNIFSFDQWGVELGKKLATNILPELKHNDPVNTHDSSTNGLINTFKQWRT